MSGTLRLRGTTSGYSELQAPAIAGDQTFILPAVGGTLLTTASPAPTLTLELGTVTSPSLTFEGDLNTGIYSPGANQLAITTGGGQRLYVGSNGRVGIGTGSPDAQLKVQAPNSDSITSAFAVRQNNAADSAQATCIIEQDPVNSSSRIIANGTTTPSLKLGTASTVAVTINSSQQVGIGTSVPIVPLHVIGNQLFEGDMELRPPSSGSEGGQITIKNPGGSTIGATIDVSTADSFRIFQLNDNSTMELGQLSGTGGTVRFATSGSERMRINSSGNVGIGTSVPTNRLHVQKNTGGVINLGTGTTNANSVQGLSFFGRFISGVTPAAPGQLTSYIREERQGSTAAFHLTFGTATNTDATERMRIDSSGNVGIGTGSPVQKLTVGSPTGQDQRITIFSSATGNGSPYGSIDFRISNGSVPGNINAKISAVRQGGSSGADLVFYTRSHADAVNSDGGEERMRIRSNGSVNIGTTTNIDEASGTVTGATFYESGILGLSADNDRALFIKRLNSNGVVARFRRNNTNVGAISVTTTSTSYNTSSDYRLKENVVTIDGAIDRVKQLSPCRFNFIAEPDITVDGFLAHEAQAVVPESVTGVKDEMDKEGNPEYQSIDQSKLVPLLTAALQEAITKIETLESQVASLQASA